LIATFATYVSAAAMRLFALDFDARMRAVERCCRYEGVDDQIAPSSIDDRSRVGIMATLPDSLPEQTNMEFRTSELIIIAMV
jgi:hypothetical protein